MRTQATVKRDEAEQQKQQDAQEIETLKAERDALVAKINTELSAEIQSLRGEVEKLRSESASLQQTLEEERISRQTETASNEQGASVS